MFYKWNFGFKHGESFNEKEDGEDVPCRVCNCIKGMVTCQDDEQCEENDEGYFIYI